MAAPVPAVAASAVAAPPAANPPAAPPAAAAASPVPSWPSSSAAAAGAAPRAVTAARTTASAATTLVPASVDASTVAPAAGGDGGSRVADGDGSAAVHARAVAAVADALAAAEGALAGVTHVTPGVVVAACDALDRAVAQFEGVLTAVTLPPPPLQPPPPAAVAAAVDVYGGVHALVRRLLGTGGLRLRVGAAAALPSPRHGGGGARRHVALPASGLRGGAAYAALEVDTWHYDATLTLPVIGSSHVAACYALAAADVLLAGSVQRWCHDAAAAGAVASAATQRAAALHGAATNVALLHAAAGAGAVTLPPTLARWAAALSATPPGSLPTLVAAAGWRPAAAAAAAADVDITALTDFLRPTVQVAGHPRPPRPPLPLVSAVVAGVPLRLLLPLLPAAAALLDAPAGSGSGARPRSVAAHRALPSPIAPTHASPPPRVVLSPPPPAAVAADQCATLPGGTAHDDELPPPPPLAGSKRSRGTPTGADVTAVASQRGGGDGATPPPHRQRAIQWREAAPDSAELSGLPDWDHVPAAGGSGGGGGGGGGGGVPLRPSDAPTQFARWRARYQGLSRDDLVAALRHNGAKVSGTVSELVERCVDAAVNGVLPRCPSCHGGFLFALWSRTLPATCRYVCPGGFDDVRRERIVCPYTAAATAVTRLPWRVM